jgi:peptidoglycan/LPS O-acetylase OafA/YrhL
MQVVGDFVKGRDNNYNAIRFLAALAVIYSHSFPISGAGGDPSFVPGESYGGFGVSVFFILSGFLVARSWDQNPSPISFIVARSLRIFPGLFVVLILSIFVLGVGYSSLGVLEFLGNGVTIDYLLKNMQMLPNEVRYYLPSVFEENPLKSVNGSLWTLPWELWMYVSLAFLGLLGLFKIPRVLGFICLVLMGLSVWNSWTGAYTEYYPLYAIKLSSIFFSGVFFYINRDRIPLNLWLLAAVIALSVYFSYENTRVFVSGFPVVLPYIVFCCAYLIHGKIRVFNKVGDYSYGLYIYAFPIQQAYVASFPSIGAIDLFMLSAATTLILSIFSWHLIEKKALTFKSAIDARRKPCPKPFSTDGPS